MTTPKPYHAPKGTVTFGKPAVGPKIYLSRGPSGWSEQFSRKLADKALVEFLSPLQLDDVLRTFATSMTLEGREEGWGDVVAFLGQLTTTHGKHIPEIVSVAFWGRYLIMQREGAN